MRVERVKRSKTQSADQQQQPQDQRTYQYPKMTRMGSYGVIIPALQRLGARNNTINRTYIARNGPIWVVFGGIALKRSLEGDDGWPLHPEISDGW